MTIALNQSQIAGRGSFSQPPPQVAHLLSLSEWMKELHRVWSFGLTASLESMTNRSREDSPAPCTTRSGTSTPAVSNAR